MGLSDRIIVFNVGKIVGNLTQDEFDVNRIGLMIAGITEESV